jgi:hypothetical protein
MSDFQQVFDVPDCSQVDVGSVIVLPTKLWYFFRAKRSLSDDTVVIKRTTFDRAFVDDEAFLNADAWAAPAEVQTPPLAGYYAPGGQSVDTESIESPKGLFALNLDGTIYLFWYDQAGELFGTKSQGDDRWSPRFKMEGVNVRARTRMYFQAIPSRARSCWGGSGRYPAVVSPACFLIPSHRPISSRRRQAPARPGRPITRVP